MDYCHMENNFCFPPISDRIWKFSVSPEVIWHFLKLYAIFPVKWNINCKKKIPIIKLSLVFCQLKPNLMVFIFLQLIWKQKAFRLFPIASENHKYNLPRNLNRFPRENLIHLRNYSIRKLAGNLFLSITFAISNPAKLDNFWLAKLDNFWLADLGYSGERACEELFNAIFNYLMRYQFCDIIWGITISLLRQRIWEKLFNALSILRNL